ncbi:hypothetical protein BLOT_000080 [Blomia tropicalis]|nr:hypothetical protein BLOT_000080 [Blomia tropicalis]
MFANSGSFSRSMFNHLIDNRGRPRTVLCHTTGKLVKLQKFCVTAIVLSRLELSWPIWQLSPWVYHRKPCNCFIHLIATFRWFYFEQLFWGISGEQTPSFSTRNERIPCAGTQRIDVNACS